MNKPLLLLVLLVAFAVSFFVGSGTPANAQALDDLAIELQPAEAALAVDGDLGFLDAADVAAIEATGVDRDRMKRLMRLAAAIHKACPCNGPVEDGEQRAWKNHGEFVQCVTDRVKELEDKGLPAELGAKIIARAAASKVGQPDFECPKRLPPAARRAVATRLAMAVNRACPCNGPVVEGEQRPWQDHGEYVDCVTAKLREMTANGLDEDVAKRVLERAKASKIGEEGFQCPPLRPRPRP